MSRTLGAVPFNRAAAVRGATAALQTYSRARTALVKTRTGTTQRTRDAAARLFVVLSQLQAEIPANLRATDAVQGVGDAPRAPAATSLELRIGAWVDEVGAAGMARLYRAVDAVNRVAFSVVNLYGRFWANNPLGRTLLDMYAALKQAARAALDSLRAFTTGAGMGVGVAVVVVGALWLWSRKKGR